MSEAPGTSDRMLGWHFGGEKLSNGDGRIVRVGETLTVPPPIELCAHGLHASARVIDALYYETGDILRRVRLSGLIICGDDKACATERTVLWELDADATETVLRQFARWCALQVLDLWNAPAVVVEYLSSGDESIRGAAEAAARDAARDEAGAAAWAASRAAARVAAGDAAGAAWAASRPADWNAVRAQQNRQLTRMCHAAHRSS